MRHESLTQQASFPGMCQIEEAVDTLAHGATVGERGAIFTKREVVDFMLDLAGYTPDRDLWKLKVLEPAFGDGDFLLAVVERLLFARSRAISQGTSAPELRDCIRAVELHRATYVATKAKVIRALESNGISTSDAKTFAEVWLIQSDFLLSTNTEPFDVVVGNPPYVRQELIPTTLLNEYRRRYSTLYDRADLYVPFIQQSLTSLKDQGTLCFICADRWIKNKYGTPLRAFVAEGYWLKAYVDMTDTAAFHSDVSAYPAITLFQKASAGATRVARQPEIDRTYLKTLSSALLAPAVPADRGVREIQGVMNGSEPWILNESGHLQIIRRLEAGFPTIEEAGCKVGIGVATGADQAFVAPFDTLDVEEDRKLPLVMTKDIASGHVQWRGFGVINPFTDEGPLVDLDQYPKLRAFLEAHKDVIVRRHVAQKAPGNWYRTIDRITPALTYRPKLLIPDIKGDAQVVYEGGQLYPHHNLYYVESREWDLHALQAVLLSKLTRLFIATYSTKMRGGFLRFQAQYLRRIRLPHWVDVTEALRRELITAARALDIPKADAAVAKLYGLSAAEDTLVYGAADGPHESGSSR